MRFIITSGATFAPWDRVRGITNLSKGTTGAKIAECALLAGHSVDYIAKEDTKQPFEKQLSIDINRNPEEIIRFLQSDEYLKISNVLKNNYAYHRTPTFEDYLRECLQVPDNNSIEKQIFIASAAVSDYAPIQEMETSSKADEMSLPLKKLPKVIQKVREVHPNLPMVGFKLLSTESSTEEELVEIAYKSVLDIGMSYVVANLVNADFKPVITMIIDDKKNITPIEDRRELAPRLVSIIENRFDTPKI